MKPDAVLRAERVLGVEAESWTPIVSRGWSRNEHWTIACTDGTRAFLKVASIEPSPQWVRDEVHVYECVEGPFMPRFLGWEDGEEPLLVLEDVSAGGRFPPPWEEGDVDAVLAALHEVAAVEVTGELAPLGSLAGWHDVARPGSIPLARARLARVARFRAARAARCERSHVARRRLARALRRAKRQPLPA